MMDIRHQQVRKNKWSYIYSDKTRKQRFQAQVQVNSYEVPQEKTFFYPITVQFIQPLNRNLLYPFYVYENK